MRDIYRAEHWDSFRDFDSTWPDRLKKSVDRGLRLELTRVDLNVDGKPESLARVTITSERPCHPQEEIKQGSTGRKPILIVDSALTKVEGTTMIKDDVFLYKGKVYADKLTGYSEQVRPKVGHDAMLSLYQFGRYGAGRICKFFYNAATRSQTESSRRR